MEHFNGMGKLLIILGLIITVVGLLVTFAGKIPFPGKLPGDIMVQKKNFTFYFPLATSIILSVLLSLVLYLIRKFQ
jgi:hypothetical protein